MNHLRDGVAAILFGVGVVTTSMAADVKLPTPLEAGQQDIEHLAVMIDCAVGDEHGVGIIFGEENHRLYIATAAHVVLGCARGNRAVRVQFSQPTTTTEGKILKYGMTPLDLAVVGVTAPKIDVSTLPFARLGNAAALTRGDPVFALGARWAVNVVPDRLARKDEDVLQFESNTTRPGSSGGPMLNERWQIVGMVRSIASPNSEATSIRRIVSMLREWKFPVALRWLPVVSAGDELTCQLTMDDRVRCWEDDDWARRSAGAEFNSHIIPGIRFKSVSVGGDHACGVTLDGTGYCWGSNKNGQLGGGSNAGGSTAPVPVLGALKFASISAGGWHTCALTPEGRAYCWGAGREGRLGNDSGEDSSVPVSVAGGLVLSSISAGTWNSCGVATDGTAYCWGGVGGTGISRSGTDPPNAFVPRPVPAKVALKAMSAGGYQSQSCGLASSGTVYCWGAPDANGSYVASSIVPDRVSGPQLVFKSVHHGLGQHACGVAANGAAYCWGANDRGQLGDGSTRDSKTPVRVAGGLTFAVVTTGTFHSCGVTVDGAIYCWGARGSDVKTAITAPVRIPDAR